MKKDENKNNKKCMLVFVIINIRIIYRSKRCVSRISPVIETRTIFNVKSYRQFEKTRH